MSMVERVAKAIFEADITSTQKDFPDIAEAVLRTTAEGLFKDHHMAMARAAIEAMREPTEAMVDAMNDVSIDGAAYVTMNASMADCAALFTAGIDAALNEEG